MQLPVLPTHPPVTDPQREEIATGLRAVCRGEVRFGRHERMLYATDASMYQVEPVGVVVPRDAEDARAVVAWCGERAVTILPRGGGTSLAGMTTSHAVVVDMSAWCRGVGVVSEWGGHACVDVEPGVTIDVLNATLARGGAGDRWKGMFFAPDPATTAQATIGGNIGTNAAGARSIRYGRVSENLLGLDCVLASGERVRFERGAGTANATARGLAERVTEIARRHERLIRERFPKTLRQSSGYALDRVLKQLDAGATAETLDLAQLLCGSAGTLAFTLGARLKLHLVPRGRGLALLAFASLEKAIEATGPILATGPSAVELVDDVVIEAARGNRECSRYVDAFPRVPTAPDRDPAAVLYVEYQEREQAEIAGKFEELRGVVGAATPARLLTAPSEMADAWRLRKAGEPLLHGLRGARKPVTFVEDNAVPVENLPRFVREFKAIVARAGTRAAFWAHASVGVLHVRPMLNPHDGGDMELLKRIAVEVADLARDCGGIMSGEHGDGRIRGPLLERFFGPELMGAFRDVKTVFDPRNLMNPDMTIRPGPVEAITERTRYQPGVGELGKRMRPHVLPTQTYFDYGDQEGFDHAVEMCNGAGVCRKTQGGTMCPSYRATRDERHSTRGRGNALRLAITGQLTDEALGTGPEWSEAGTVETLRLCLSCKACKTECPSNVDVARLKAEYTAQAYRHRGVPYAAWLIGNVRFLNRMGSMMPGLANWAGTLAPVRWVLGRMMNVHPKRPLPKFSNALTSREREFGVGSSDYGASQTPRQRVVLFADCFTTYNESEIGVAAGRVLTRLGYEVVVADAGCCGRSMISVGMLGKGIQTIDATLARMRPLIESDCVKAIVVCEPSCLSAMKDDWLQLKCRTPIELRQKLAVKAMLVEDFVDREWDRHPRRPSPSEAAFGPVQGAVLHAHCHQKALWGAETSARALRRLLGDRLRVLDTGCCGMAGSFGYDRDKFDLSMKIANLPAEEGGLMPQVAAAGDATVLATGTSCRHQIADASGGARRAMHPIELIDQLLG